MDVVGKYTCAADRRTRRGPRRAATGPAPDAERYARSRRSAARRAGDSAADDGPRPWRGQRPVKGWFARFRRCVRVEWRPWAQFSPSAVPLYGGAPSTRSVRCRTDSDGQPPDNPIKVSRDTASDTMSIAGVQSPACRDRADGESGRTTTKRWISCFIQLQSFFWFCGYSGSSLRIHWADSSTFSWWSRSSWSWSISSPGGGRSDTARLMSTEGERNEGI